MGAGYTFLDVGHTPRNRSYCPAVGDADSYCPAAAPYAGPRVAIAGHYSARGGGSDRGFASLSLLSATRLVASVHSGGLFGCFTGGDSAAWAPRVVRGCIALAVGRALAASRSTFGFRAMDQPGVSAAQFACSCTDFVIGIEARIAEHRRGRPYCLPGRLARGVAAQSHRRAGAGASRRRGMAHMDHGTLSSRRFQKGVLVSGRDTDRGG